MKEKFAFITSVRFWKLVIAAFVWGFFQAESLPVEVATPIIALLLGDVTIKTIDRGTEKLGK